MMNLKTRIGLFFAKNRSAIHSIIDGWKHLLGVTNESDQQISSIHLDPHPISLCKCHGDRHSGNEIYDDHLSECEWLKVRCRTCQGTGWCQSCFGDGVGRRDEDENSREDKKSRTVSTDALTPTEIRIADAQDRLIVDDDGYGTVYGPDVDGARTPRHWGRSLQCP